MTSMLKKSGVAMAATAALGLMACNGMTDLKEGLPSTKQVNLNLKGKQASGQSLVDDTTKLAGFYELTYGMTTGINAIVVAHLDLTRVIVNMQPSERPDDDHAVWGPSEPKGLERLQYKATGERVVEGEFNFALLARPKSSTAEDDYKEVYSIHYFRTGVEKGHGELIVNRDNHRAIDPQGDGNCDKGYATVAFSNDASDSVKHVDIDLSKLDRSACPDYDGGQATTYRYAEAADGAGDFTFVVDKSIQAASESKPLIETLTIRSSWLATGAGRADLVVSGGEVTSDLAACSECGGASVVRATQCWDANFISRFEDTTPAQLRNSILPGVDASGNPNPTGNESACVLPYADPTAVNP